MVTTIGVVGKLDTADTVTIVGRLKDLITARGGRIMVDRPLADALARPELYCEVEQWPHLADFAVSIGGDGTLLHTARMLAGSELPILGINTGRLGFLTEMEHRDLDRHLPRFLAGEYVLEERIMLDVAVERAGVNRRRFSALNDAVVARGGSPHIVQIQVTVSGVEAASYPADGVIVSTPTGSTAYSLSAGGPVVFPGLKLLVVTPICPHSFYARSILVAADDVVRIAAQGSAERILSLDGREGHELEPADVVEIRRARAVTRLMRSPDYNFYQLVRRKLAEPDR